MNMTFRKSLAVVLLSFALATLAFALPEAVTTGDSVEVQAEETATLAASSGKCGDKLTWTLDDEGTLTISGSGEMTDWEDGVSAPWYSSGSSVKKVVISDGVTSIGEYAFSECTSLTSIDIPNSVTSIGKLAFYNCITLSSIEIPDSVTSMGKSVFYKCFDLTSVKIGNGVTSISDSSFESCTRLESIVIPDSVTSIGQGAFANCASLASAEVSNSVKYIGDWAFFYCGNLKEITIPASVTKIEEEAFIGCSNLTIFGYAGTYAETYANAVGKPFVDIVPSFSTSMQAYLNLEGLISMSVGYKFNDMESINPEDYKDKVGLLMWSAAEAPEEANATYENCPNILEGAVYNSVLGRFETTTEGIVAKKLGDALAFRTYYKNDDGSYTYGRLISNYSPKTYCYNQINNNPDDETRIELMASILNYGAAAQKFFNYNIDNLMNSELPEELK